MATYTFNVTNTGANGTIQSWTVPTSGIYTIECWGAAGSQGNGGSLGGNGAYVKGDFTLTAGQTLRILVGQMGLISGSGTGDRTSGGGGGGSYVAVVDAASSYILTTDGSKVSPLIIAAGGGGGNDKAYQGTQADGRPGQSASNAVSNTNNSGGGWNSTNAVGTNGQSFLQGGAGGSYVRTATATGGFGGGGATDDSASGGGGWLGGTATVGAYSVNMGTNTSGTDGINATDGKVVISSMLVGDTLDGIGTPNTLTMQASLYSGTGYTRYFRWTTIPNQMDVATVVNVGASTDTGVWTSVLTGRTAGTTYYYQAYVSNGTTTNYGAIKSVTLPLGIASSKSYTPSALTTTTATLVGAILDMNQ